MTSTTAIFGTCVRCGWAVTGSGVHVQRRKLLEPAFPGCTPTIMFGPETDLFHLECFRPEPEAFCPPSIPLSWPAWSGLSDPPASLP